MNVNKAAPAGLVAARVPYGLAPLVSAAKALVERHVLSDVTDLVQELSAANDLTGPWTRLAYFAGAGSRAGQGILDFVNHPRDGRQMASFLVRSADDDRVELAVIRLSSTPPCWAPWAVMDIYGATPAWAAWATAAAEYLKTFPLIRPDNPLHCEQALRTWQEDCWNAVALGHLRPAMPVVDGLDEPPPGKAQPAQVIHLITPYLAGRLRKAGANADIVRGLPLWARNNLDSPHLEPVLQDLAYETFGASIDNALARNATEEKYP